MGTTIERIREICKERGIAISSLEKALGYSNGYLNPKKAKDVSGSRLVEIAEYLGVSVSKLLGEEEKSAALPEEDGDIMMIREAIRDNPALRSLLTTAIGLPASRIYETAALLSRYREEQDDHRER
jgi:transcriptional regulator with XRE-family HTH domain